MGCKKREREKGVILPELETGYRANRTTGKNGTVDHAGRAYGNGMQMSIGGMLSNPSGTVYRNSG
jgi:hypothetical protein